MTNPVPLASYVFTRSLTNCTQQAKLIAEEGASYAKFGWSVALMDDGSTALIGASGAYGRGTAYDFVRNGTAWSEWGELESRGPNGSVFGSAVAVNSDATIALVGAAYETVNAQAEQGAAYGFVLSTNQLYLPLIVC